jgi:hypothetical protein
MGSSLFASGPGEYRLVININIIVLLHSEL